MRSGSRVVAVLVGFLLAFPTFFFAQSATTSLHGTVYDPKGAVVAGATLMLSNAATGFSRTAKSDSQGTYQFLELPPAKYDLNVNAGGFAAVKMTGIELLVD